MKRRLLSALVLSTLITNAPMAMEMETSERPHKMLKIAPPERHLEELPEEVLYMILSSCDLQAFCALKQTCKKFYKIASDSTFYLAEKPDELLKQLERFIDQKNQTFRFNALLPLMARTPDVGDRLYAAGKDYVFDPQHPTEGQPKGFALWLAECVFHEGAEKKRDVLKKPLEHICDQAFFHLLPSKGDPYAENFEVERFESYKLMADFYEFSKKYAQTQEKLYLGPEDSFCRFRDILGTVTGSPIDEVGLGLHLNEKSREIIAFFQKKELASFFDDADKINEFLEKRKGTDRESVLKGDLDELFRYAKELLLLWIEDTPQHTEKQKLYLQIPRLQEKIGRWNDAAHGYFFLGKSGVNGAEKLDFLLKSAALFEKAGEKWKAAVAYSCARSLEEGFQRIRLMGKIFSLYNEWGQKTAAEHLNNCVLGRSPFNKAEKADLFLKAAALFEKVGDKLQAAVAYSRAAIFSESFEKGAPFFIKAAVLYDELGQKMMIEYLEKRPRG